MNSLPLVREVRQGVIERRLLMDGQPFPQIVELHLQTFGKLEEAFRNTRGRGRPGSAQINVNVLYYGKRSALVEIKVN